GRARSTTASSSFSALIRSGVPGWDLLIRCMISACSHWRYPIRRASALAASTAGESCATATKLQAPRNNPTIVVFTALLSAISEASLTRRLGQDDGRTGTALAARPQQQRVSPRFARTVAQRSFLKRK